MLLVGCAGDSATPALSALPQVTTSPVVSAVVTLPARPTLPPTWTPTHTITPRPPTQIPTATATPSVTPTLSDADRCARFALVGSPRSGLRVTRRETGRVLFTWQYPVEDGSVALAIGREPGGARRVMTVPGNALVAVAAPLDALFGPGTYRWTVGPVDAAGQPLGCSVSGWFGWLLRDRAAVTDSSGPARFTPD